MWQLRWLIDADQEFSLLDVEAKLLQEQVRCLQLERGAKLTKSIWDHVERCVHSTLYYSVCVQNSLLLNYRVSGLALLAHSFTVLCQFGIAYLMYWKLVKPLLGDVHSDEWLHWCLHSCVYRPMLVLTYWVTSHNLDDFQHHIRQHTA